MAIVYKHYTKTDNRLFYVGIGKKKDRATSTKNRNNHWLNIVKKHGFYSEIVNDNISFQRAKEIEIDLISKYGRIDIGTGILVNMTDGGDGRLNSRAWNKGVSFLSGKANPMYGFKRSKCWIKKHSERAKKVNKKGAEHFRSMQVFDFVNGIFYDSAKEASESTTYSYSYFKQMINGSRPNKTNMVYATLYIERLKDENRSRHNVVSSQG